MKLAYSLVLAASATSLLGSAPVPRHRGTVVHQVTMVAEGSTYRFEPAKVSIKSGDAVRFVMASGGPHNVAFDGEKLGAAAKAALDANMPDRLQPLAGKLLTVEGESYTVSFAGVPAGTYPYFCMPHMAMGMQGSIIVE